MSSSKPQGPPPTLAELARRAERNGLDRPQSFKLSLRSATTLRHQGERYKQEGDLENAFVYLIGAANIILEKLPRFTEYHNLTTTQRENLRANGEEIQHALESLKPQLVDRYEKWAANPEHSLLTPTATIRVPQPDRQSTRDRDLEQRERERDAMERDAREREARDWQEKRRRADEEAERRERDIAAARRLQEHLDPARRRMHQQQIDVPPSANLIPPDFRRRDPSSEDIARHVQEQAAERKRQLDAEEQARRIYHEEQARRRESDTIRARMEEEGLRRRQEEESRRRYEEEASRRRQAEEATRRRQEEESARRRQEEEFARRRQEEESAWRRQDQTRHTFPAIRSPTQFEEGPVVPRQSQSPTRQAYAEDSSSGADTDVEPLPTSLRPSGGRPVTRSHSYPPPITTTSLLPPELARNSIEYPKLMTSHQQSQGYQPSPQSMFSPPQPEPQRVDQTPPNSLLFQPLYSGSLPNVSRPIPFPGAQPQSDSIVKRPFHYKENPPVRPPSGPVPFHPHMGYPYANPPQFPQAQPQYPPNQYRPRAGPPPPPPAFTAAVVPPRPPKESIVAYPTLSQSAIEPPPRAVVVPDPVGTPPSPGANELRVVELPTDTLPRFLSIAAANTEKNKETCGLLLGTLAQNVFRITTLLIPQQSATSDSCTMEAEELVFEFQDSRDLLTLGWIHTHPTQSCFMSSLDLHTHAGFQSMLPEAIAVVCAPKFKPHFGIFRLTDPPGLQVIQKCTVKETFHPHPALPIYTDCGSEHVKLQDDAHLEISDLRHSPVS